MTKSILITFAILSFTACGKNGTSVQKAPPQLIGSWAITTTQNAAATNATATPTNPKPVDTCSGVNEQGATDIGILRIYGNGWVYAGQQSGGVTTFVQAGKIIPDAMFVPMPGTEAQYLNGFAKLQSSSTSVKPLIHLKISDDEMSLAMEIQVISNSASGVATSGVIETRNYGKVTAAQEKTLIEKAQQCLSHAGPN